MIVVVLASMGTERAVECRVIETIGGADVDNTKDGKD